MHSTDLTFTLILLTLNKLLIAYKSSSKLSITTNLSILCNGLNAITILSNKGFFKSQQVKFTDFKLVDFKSRNTFTFLLFLISPPKFVLTIKIYSKPVHSLKNSFKYSAKSLLSTNRA
jgi:hypothetical protein